MNELLRQQQGKQFIGTSELAAIATAVLLDMGAAQERGTVKDVIDERTVRYYQSEGLIDTPTERRGPASVYEYRHLLTLIVIKHLQSADLPIRKIRRIIQGMSEAELESLLEETPILSRKPREARHEARRYLDQISKTLEWEPKPLKSSPPRSPRMNAPEELLSRTGMDSQPEDHWSFSRLSVNYRSAVPEEKGERWKRFELLPGIELHIKEEAEQSLDSKGRITLLKKIETLIRSLVDRE